MSLVLLLSLILAGFGAYALFGPGANADHAAQPEDATVRIAARHLESGGVQVALQELDPGGEWGSRHTPGAGVLPADAPVGAWRYSSGLSVRTFWPDGSDAHDTEGMFSSPRILHDGLACVIGHGNPADDLFWSITESAVFGSSYLNRFSTRLMMTSDATEQAAAIRQCTEDGAFAIGATLANFDAVSEALLEAGEAGVEVYTYNSGADRASEVNSILHVSLDERAGGRLAGQRMNDAEVSGEIYCLIHEEVNVGLDERCEGLEAAYQGGAVTRVRVHDEEERTRAAEALADPTIGGAIALNSNTGIWLAGAAEAAGRDDLYIATFGVNLMSLLDLVTGRVQFAIWDQPTLQGMFVANALRTRHLAPTPPLLQLGGARVSIEPVLFDRQRLIETLRALPPETLANLMTRAGVSQEQIEQLAQLLDG